MLVVKISTSRKLLAVCGGVAGRQFGLICGGWVMIVKSGDGKFRRGTDHQNALRRVAETWSSGSGWLLDEAEGSLMTKD